MGTIRLLEFDKSAESPVITLTGERLIRYTLSYSNTGTVDALNVSITETVPEHTTYDEAESDSGWSCADNSAAGTNCQFNVGSVDVGESGQVIFAVIVDPNIDDSVTSIVNSATLSVQWVSGAGGPIAAAVDEYVVQIQRPTGLIGSDQPQYNHSLRLPLVVK